MHDGAPYHIGNNAKTLIRVTFGDRIISKHFPKNWLTRSPDMILTDFRLLGYPQERINKCTTREELKLSTSLVFIFQGMLFLISFIT